MRRSKKRENSASSSSHGCASHGSAEAGCGQHPDVTQPERAIRPCSHSVAAGGQPGALQEADGGVKPCRWQHCGACRRPGSGCGSQACTGKESSASAVCRSASTPVCPVVTVRHGSMVMALVVASRSHGGAGHAHGDGLPWKPISSVTWHSRLCSSTGGRTLGPTVCTRLGSAP
eukprot:363998-Chlamydomonas_euryale.AAC.9